MSSADSFIRRNSNAEVTIKRMKVLILENVMRSRGQSHAVAWQSFQKLKRVASSDENRI